MIGLAIVCTVTPRYATDSSLEYSGSTVLRVQYFSSESPRRVECAGSVMHQNVSRNRQEALITSTLYCLQALVARAPSNAPRLSPYRYSD